MKEIILYQWVLFAAIVAILILTWKVIVLKHENNRLKKNKPSNYYGF